MLPGAEGEEARDEFQHDHGSDSGQDSEDDG